MNATVIGSQLGDEGKGAVVDVLGSEADVVVRYQGGDNAGHTVTHRGEEYRLRLLPSGVVRGKLGVLGNGCAVNFGTLFDEVDRLRERGLDPDVRVSGRAHVVLPSHRVLDGASESARSDDDLAVGTTGNGMGPAYEDKAGRRGVRIAEVLRPDALRERLEYTIPRHRELADAVYGIDPDGALPDGPAADSDDAADAFDVDAVFERLRSFGDRLAADDVVVDAGPFLAERQREGATILFESAQGTQIDLDHGNYPYVTSSNPTAGGAVVGTGVGPETVADGAVVGVVKAYLSRVGCGPMPTELDAEAATVFRERVDGFGTVTERPRRIGWLDLPVLRTATRVNGFSGLAFTHVDSLGGLDELRVCTGYELDGERVRQVPMTSAAWRQCTPEYEQLEPWPDCDWEAVAADGYDALPENARTFVEFVSDDLGVPVVAVGVGPDREATVVRRNPLADEPLSGAN
ncbi:adenylosuccinate synthase [Halosimplex salinum]|uniref:adenylosuccinate synthase n=1 Tax=Halosimplex salinum TaxID=1710538 RepID=UPI000F48AF00|nr:adenylosuccinate synthase [Halosimplex salinum]